MIKAVNIEWETDGDLVNLPTTVDIPPKEVNEYLYENDDAISDYLSNETGYCHRGYNLIYCLDNNIIEALKAKASTS